LLPNRFRLVLASFLSRPGLPFADALPEDAMQRAFDEEDAWFADDPDAVYTPAITLWAFLSQVLFKCEQRSCVAAVARVSVLLVALNRKPCSTNTAAYCRARAKLSESVLHRIAVEVADGCEVKLEDPWLWHDRHVRLVDGATASMPDTPENQAVYPQARTQKEGLGFPVARIVVLLSLATGMAQDMAVGPYRGKKTGETALLRQLLERFRPSDILLADRYYCSYFMIALFMEAGVDFVTRMHQARATDLSRGRRLGKGDHLIRWTRPARPSWMDQQTYDQMPDFLDVRAVQVQVGAPGQRTDSFIVVTTLTDATTYKREEIAELYHYRWRAELDIRSIKVTLGMDVLRCKTPEMVRKEMWTCILAYNLIRRSMLESARAAGVLPTQLSLTAALQATAASWMVIAWTDDTRAAILVEAGLATATEHPIGNRPGRVEPRAVKRRPKPHDLLTEPRAEARAKLLEAKVS
jgi:hypothetical protein